MSIMRDFAKNTYTHLERVGPVQDRRAAQIVEETLSKVPAIFLDPYFIPAKKQ